VNLGTHAGFIVAAYTAALLVVGGLIVWVVTDYRAQRRTLGELERDGRGKVS
jgi:heme exporter protein D